MKSIRLKAYGKINLSLDVLGKYENGFHQVEMIMQAVKLSDDVLIRWWDNNKDLSISLKTNKYYLPNDEKNIAYKAAKLMADRYLKNCRGSLRIDIGKNIPVAAGMAGGSSNCAAVLLGINHMFKLGLSLEKLCDISKELGSDIVFSLISNAKGNRNLSMEIKNSDIAGFCAIATGTGTDLKLIQPLKSDILLSKPPISVSTEEVFKNLKIDNIKKHPNIDKITDILENKANIIYAKDDMANVLETYTLNRYSIVKKTKSYMKSILKSGIVMMSGSGPTIFGISQNIEEFEEGFVELKKINMETYKTRTMI